ncbi:hypothetical protein A2U01_0092389, partial [Trifolium medium]|nr:hypothetical protein [Trifolium medium]
FDNMEGVISNAEEDFIIECSIDYSK